MTKVLSFDKDSFSLNAGHYVTQSSNKHKLLLRKVDKLMETMKIRNI